MRDHKYTYLIQLVEQPGSGRDDCPVASLQCQRPMRVAGFLVQKLPRGARPGPGQRRWHWVAPVSRIRRFLLSVSWWEQPEHG
jgi:hypothetical protein